jgi:hypothetical protein
VTRGSRWGISLSLAVLGALAGFFIIVAISMIFSWLFDSQIVIKGRAVIALPILGTIAGWGLGTWITDPDNPGRDRILSHARVIVDTKSGRLLISALAGWMIGWTIYYNEENYYWSQSDWEE